MLAANHSDSERRASWFRFRIIHLAYLTVVLGSSFAVAGGLGLVMAFCVLSYWLYVFRSPSPVQAVVRSGSYAVIFSIVGCCLLPAVTAQSGAREAAYSMNCSSNLKQLVLAIHNYHDTHGRLPPAALSDGDGRPAHSWRTMVLPYLDSSNLHSQYSYDEPWDGPNNRRLKFRAPRVFQCPSFQGPESKTNYFAIVGPNAAWMPDAQRDFKDFASTDQCILVIESHVHDVDWTEPQDIPIEEARRMLTGINFQHAAHRYQSSFSETIIGNHVGLADGGIRTFAHGANEHAVGVLLRFDEAIPGLMENRFGDQLGSRTSHYRWSFIVPLLVFVLAAFIPLMWVRDRRRRVRYAARNTVA